MIGKNILVQGEASYYKNERDDLYIRQWSDLKKRKESDERAWLKGRPSTPKERFSLKENEFD